MILHGQKNSLNKSELIKGKRYRKNNNKKNMTKNGINS